MLKETIQADIKQAMRAKEPLRVTTLRMLIAAIKQQEIDKKIEMNDQLVLSIIQKMIKQRRDSADQFIQADRQALADKELAEIALLEVYLPAQLDDAAIASLVDQTITNLNASSMKDMGKVMGQLTESLQGQADMGAVSQIVKEKLS